MHQPPIIPGSPPAQQAYTLGAVMPGPPPKRGVHPLSIVLAVVGGVALLCGGVLSIGSLASTGAAGKPSPSAVYVYLSAPPAVAPAVTTPAPAPTTTKPPPPPPPGPPTMSGGGILLVPSEAQPGTWRTTVPEGESCYWARLKGTGGTFDDIITNGNANAGERVTVTIKSADKAFEFTPGCGTWTKIG